MKNPLEPPVQRAKVYRTMHCSLLAAFAIVATASYKLGRVSWLSFEVFLFFSINRQTEE